MCQPLLQMCQSAFPSPVMCSSGVPGDPTLQCASCLLVALYRALLIARVRAYVVSTSFPTQANLPQNTVRPSTLYCFLFSLVVERRDYPP